MFVVVPTVLLAPAVGNQLLKSRIFRPGKSRSIIVIMFVLASLTLLVLMSPSWSPTGDESLRKRFDKLDLDGNQGLRKDEMNKNYVKEYGRENRAHVDNLFKKFDADQDTYIGIDGFKKFATATTIDRMDIDGSKSINREELGRFYRNTYGKTNDQFSDDFFTKFDKNRDGWVDFSELEHG